MTKLSVNVNKIALLRNSRGRDFPNVLDFAKRFIKLGVQGITVHPRQDQRHITNNDAYELAEMLSDFPEIEYNIEGYPSQDFLKIIKHTKPDQCTLVPDGVDQITSDHGWDMRFHQMKITSLAKEIKDYGVRCAIFLDPELEQVELVSKTGADRIELYTEKYANSFVTNNRMKVFEKYSKAAKLAQELGLGVNAGHDLDSKNLGYFLTIPNILEVSIGHVLTVDCLLEGMPVVVERYLKLCNSNVEV